MAEQYERHMPPGGVDGLWACRRRNGGERRAKTVGRKRRKGKSRAFETLETIYASSSSGTSKKGGKGRRKPAMEHIENLKEYGRTYPVAHAELTLLLDARRVLRVSFALGRSSTKTP